MGAIRGACAGQNRAQLSFERKTVAFCGWMVNTMLSPTTESVIHFLVDVLMWPATLANRPANQMLIFLALFVVFAFVFVAKRFEKKSDFARITKRVLLIAIFAFYGVWFPIAAVLSIPI